MSDQQDATGYPALGRRTLLSGMGISILGVTALSGGAFASPVQTSFSRRFGFAGPETPEGFLLDGKPFQVRAGELHPCRIPREHWRQRIQMAKAMGMNTIAIYVMWNHHEAEPGVFDFTTGNRDIGHFMQLCAAEGMWVYLRPGPYVCAEWDLGGLPAYLLRNPDIRLREADDKEYMAAVRRYLGQIAKIARPMMNDKNGPIMMVQIENEYASFGTDTTYLPALRQMWIDEGITGPFSISDGLKQIQQAKTYLDGAALGLDGDEDFATAQGVAGKNPVWVGEGYPGWLTHWGDPTFAKGDYRATMTMLMRERRSFNVYVIHGGTNFGFGAGSNAKGDGSKFEPSITSYDYGAPISENGAATRQYHDLRKTIYDAIGAPLPTVPKTPPVVGFAPVKTAPRGALWAGLKPAVASEKPQPMETLLGQTQGMILYRRVLQPGETGALKIDQLHDEALVLIDNKPLGFLSRVEPAKAPTELIIPAGKSGQKRTLDILVYPYGRINYGRYMRDRKGILGAVTLGGAELTGWQVHGLPLDSANLQQMRGAAASKGGLLHEATFVLKQSGDTFIDMSGWGVGFVWVNGNLIGRHSRLGPQTRLFCPSGWLKVGNNQITILDLYAEAGRSVQGLTQSDTQAATGGLGN